MARKKKSAINQTRGILYGLGKFLGDVLSVQKGTVGKRVARRAAGKVSGRLLGKLFKLRIEKMSERFKPTAHSIFTFHKITPLHLYFPILGGRGRCLNFFFL